MFPTAQHHFTISNSVGKAETMESGSKSATTALFSLDRTFTLPSRFKKRLLSASIANTSSTTGAHFVTDSNPPDHLTKLVDGLLKSLKHLEVIISKRKYEIISSNATQVLESVLDVYNQLRSLWNADSCTPLAKELYTHKSRVNLRLANLIKWSDTEVLLAGSQLNDPDHDSRLVASSSDLITALGDAINDLVKFCQKALLVANGKTDDHRRLIKLLDDSRRGSQSLKRTNSLDDYNNGAVPTNQKSRSSSASPLTSGSKSISSSSSINTTRIRTDDETGATTRTKFYVDDHTGMKTHEVTKTQTLQTPDPSTNIIQTTTVTRTTSGGSRDESVNGRNAEFNLPDLRAFFDFEKLAQDLSDVADISPQPESKTNPSGRKDRFTNEKCNQLLDRFENFARQLQKMEKREQQSTRLFTGSASSKSASFSSNFSTLDSRRSRGGDNQSTTTTTTSTSAFSSPIRKSITTTLYSNSAFKHDLVKNSIIDRSIDLTPLSASRIITRNIDNKLRNKVSFMETNHVTDGNLAKLLLDLDVEEGANSPKTSSNVEQSERVEAPPVELSEETNRQLITEFDADNLDPKFLLIDDEENEDDGQSFRDRDRGGSYVTINSNGNHDDDSDDDDMNDYRDGIKIKNQDEDEPDIGLAMKQTTSTSSNSSLSFASTSNGKPAGKETAMVKSSVSNFSNVVRSSNATSANSLSGLQPTCDAKSSRSQLSQMSEDGKVMMHSSLSVDSSSQSVPIDLKESTFIGPKGDSDLKPSEDVDSLDHIEPIQKQTGSSSQSDYLGLLDINHLLEYQSQSQLTSNVSLSGAGSSNSATNILLPSASCSSILRGGHVDALIVLATSANSTVIAPPPPNTQNDMSSHAYSSHTINSSPAYHSVPSREPFLSASLNHFNPNPRKKTNFLFQEAFLTTYRTILEPVDLIRKLIHRYRLFARNHHLSTSVSSVEDKDIDEKFDFDRLNKSNKRDKMAFSATRNSLTLLIRVLDGLDEELDREVIEMLSDFVFELIVDEELAMARLLRKKLLYKLERKSLEDKNKSMKMFEDMLDSSNKIKQQNQTPSKILPYLNTFTKRNYSLLDFKSTDIAEQLTLTDSSLFRKIELVEVLLWSTKQNEAHSPNLIRFTEHFNNISYWARSRILEHESYKDRERYLIKFLRIMKHLRKLNNYNSYLAILSAVDSGPIQRLDWPKSISDTIKEFSVLIDPKCGFKTLREAVSESQPPCIPHIGLILQDLTILHIANPDYLPSGNCNFWKRWQQYNILERLRCFKRCNYDIKPNAKIQEFFNNFNDFISEDAQYNLSEQLKPRLKNN